MRVELCKACNGEGLVFTEDCSGELELCPDCDGDGFITSEDDESPSRKKDDLE